MVPLSRNSFTVSLGTFLTWVHDVDCLELKPGDCFFLYYNDSGERLDRPLVLRVVDLVVPQFMELYDDYIYIAPILVVPTCWEFVDGAG